MAPSLILAVLLAYFVVLFVISRVTGRKASNSAFYLADRRSPWFVVALGMIGASLSGVTFISVPGWVIDSNFSYMQLVLGYFLGYLVIAYVLLPLYYKLNLTSIYTYLEQRFGVSSYKTGAWLFLVSRVIGASFRLFIVGSVLQVAIFDHWGVPFWVTVLITIALIWVYTCGGGLATIIWTDLLQTFFIVLAVVLTLVEVAGALGLSFSGVVDAVRESPHSRVFYFDDWRSPYYFFKHFFSGMFITIVMTGLDQDMMQKNLTCRTLRDAQKNVVTYGALFLPINLLFMVLGVLLVVYSQSRGLDLPVRTDDLYPTLALGGYLSPVVALAFLLGLIAAAYSSADSALTALTTSFTVDILGYNHGKQDTPQAVRLRKRVHVAISLVLAGVIILFRAISDDSVINAIFKVAGYTYGPLLGMFAFGLACRRSVNARAVPVIGVLSPVACYFIQANARRLFDGYQMGYELLMLNGLITFVAMLAFSRKPAAE